MNAHHKKLVEHLETTGDEFVKALLGLSSEEVNRVPAANEWSIHQAAAHVRDTESRVFLYRLERILTEELPAVPNFDQDAWTREHYSPDEPIRNIAREFAAARRKVVRQLSDVKDKDWERKGIHPAFGKISIEWLVTHFYAHTLDHIGQIMYARDNGLLRHLNT
jgi:uncharacterized damage-inducible protein DinB